MTWRTTYRRPIGRSIAIVSDILWPIRPAFFQKSRPKTKYICSKKYHPEEFATVIDCQKASISCVFWRQLLPAAAPLSFAPNSVSIDPASSWIDSHYHYSLHRFRSVAVLTPPRRPPTDRYPRTVGRPFVYAQSLASREKLCCMYADL